MVNPAPLKMWCIYDHPKDLPDWIVVRVWHLGNGNPEPVPSAVAKCYPTIEAARADLPPGLYCCLRDERDDPKIIETWL